MPIRDGKEPYLVVYEPKFFAWIAKRHAHDNARGDFIRDTRDLLAMLRKGVIDEQRINDRLWQACDEARAVYGKLLLQYRREAADERCETATTERREP